uniref:Uncharacterized protein n=1 Tax=Glossina austeni TaxID=7395 RepID=A0A1A9VXD2_GLOAU
MTDCKYLIAIEILALEITAQQLSTIHSMAVNLEIHLLILLRQLRQVKIRTSEILGISGYWLLPNPPSFLEMRVYNCNQALRVQPDLNEISFLLFIENGSVFSHLI